MRSPISIDSQSFSQFILGNANFNTQTLDGLNTFHAIGGIQCLTPSTAVAPDQKIERLTTMPTSEIVGNFGSIPLMAFEKKKESGLKAIKILNLGDIHQVSSQLLLSLSDLLWLYKMDRFALHTKMELFYGRSNKTNYSIKRKYCACHLVMHPPAIMIQFLQY